MAGLRESDLIFSSASVPIAKTLGQLKKQSLSISNRLHSVAKDAAFVEAASFVLKALADHDLEGLDFFCSIRQEIANNGSLFVNNDSRTAYNFKHQELHLDKIAVLANERCGSWYVPPSLKQGSVYFKSTDGHHGQWAFSLRRLNLHLLPVLGSLQSSVPSPISPLFPLSLVQERRQRLTVKTRVMIVDSTRQGKHLPDAFSRTIPIWAAVINRLVFPEHPVSRELFTPVALISESEHHQILSRLDAFVANARSLELDLDKLRQQLKKPVILAWVSQSCVFRARVSRPLDKNMISEANRMFLCMPSLHQDASTDTDYVQGSGDDAEHWGHGITPDVFWSNKQQLLETSEDDLPMLIRSLLSTSGSKSDGGELQAIPPTGWLYITFEADMIKRVSVGQLKEALVVVCSPALDETRREQLGARLLWLKCAAGKLGSRDLRGELVKLGPFLQAHAASDHTAPEAMSTERKIVVCCASGLDLSVGVGLALLCSHSLDNGEYVAAQADRHIDKTLIRQRLAWISSAMPSANPSRATLTAVNSFLMPP